MTEDLLVNRRGRNGAVEVERMRRLAHAGRRKMVFELVKIVSICQSCIFEGAHFGHLWSSLMVIDDGEGYDNGRWLSRQPSIVHCDGRLRVAAEVRNKSSGDCCVMVSETGCRINTNVKQTTTKKDVNFPQPPLSHGQSETVSHELCRFTILLSYSVLSIETAYLALFHWA